MRRIPHLAVPFRLIGTRAATVDQDSLDEIAQGVEAVLRTERGSRIELPEFGIDDPTFNQRGANLDAIRADVEQWEPRAAVLFERRPGLLEELVDRIRVEVRERSDGR